MNQVRIIGGVWRGRKIHFRPALQLRPTLDAVRETLFNWLMFDLQGARCLDAFAGSGALGFEALSRGAAEVSFIEYEQAVIVELKKHIQALGAASQSLLMHDSALKLLQNPCAVPFDLIFLDPPFAKGYLLQALQAIIHYAWLKPSGLVYFEAERSLPLKELLEAPWEIYRHKFMGDLQFGLLRIGTPK